MLRAIHEQALEYIKAGESGFAIANVKKNGIAEDVSFWRGGGIAGTYHGGPYGLIGQDLKEAVILSIAEGRMLACKAEPGAASPATFYRTDIDHMIRDRRRRGEHATVAALEQYLAAHPEVFIA
jgi:hypothetical protein